MSLGVDGGDSAGNGLQNVQQGADRIQGGEGGDAVFNSQPAHFEPGADVGGGVGVPGVEERVYIIEVNPRSSRTVPFLSKATGYSLADIATKVILGESLRDQGITQLYPPEKKRWYCKVPVFSFSKLSGLDAYLSPEMKSTGEAIGYDDRLPYALYKAMQAAGMNLQDHGTVLLSISHEDLEEALPLVRRFYHLGSGRTGG